MNARLARIAYAGDDDALDQRVRVVRHQRQVLAGARLALVGVDHEVVRLAVVLRDEAPLHAGREAGAAAAAQARVLDQLDQVVRVRVQRLAQRGVAVSCSYTSIFQASGDSQRLVSTGVSFSRTSRRGVRHFVSSLRRATRPASGRLVGRLRAVASADSASPPAWSPRSSWLGIGVFGSKPAPRCRAARPAGCRAASARRPARRRPRPRARRRSRPAAATSPCSVHSRAPRLGIGRSPARSCSTRLDRRLRRGLVVEELVVDRHHRAVVAGRQALGVLERDRAVGGGLVVPDAEVLGQRVVDLAAAQTSHIVLVQTLTR